MGAWETPGVVGEFDKRANVPALPVPSLGCECTRISKSGYTGLGPQKEKVCSE